eukprot:757769-Prorocentrum_minimum.AAC.4
MPEAGANRVGEKGICLKREPIASGERAYARSGSQLREDGGAFEGAKRREIDVVGRISTRATEDATVMLYS